MFILACFGYIDLVVVFLIGVIFLFCLYCSRQGMLFCLLDDSVSESDELIFCFVLFCFVFFFFFTHFCFDFYFMFLHFAFISAIVYLSGLPWTVQGGSGSRMFVTACTKADCSLPLGLSIFHLGRRV